MNSCCNLSRMDDPHFVTLKQPNARSARMIYDQVHSAPSGLLSGGVAAQEQVRGFNGAQKHLVLRAWMEARAYHEDGLSSAVDVVQGCVAQGQVSLAAE